MTEEKLKHLEFIQTIITRMNTNSFQIKEWMVTILAAFLAIFVATNNNLFILLAGFPVLIFWLLDAYYLMMERKFRGLYGDVAGLSEDTKQIKLFEMRPDLYTGGKYSYWNVIWSKTIGRLYLPIIILLIITFVIQLCFHFPTRR